MQLFSRLFPLPGRLRWVSFLLVLTACTSTPATLTDGQWLWSRADRPVYLDARATLPGLRPGVWVSSITFDTTERRLVQHLALPPTLVPGPIAIVIRFENGMHQAWDRADDAALAVEADSAVGAVLRLVRGAGVTVAEVQLDYDCPVRRLPRWAAVVGKLADGSLRNEDVWVTSLVAHLREPEYGGLFRGKVTGHIVQVFDTGEEPTPARVDELQHLLRRQRLPFRFGVGAFERRLGADSTTDHLGWFAVRQRIALLPQYRGLWVFPAGRSWLAYRGRAQ